MRAEPRMFLMDTVVPWVINCRAISGSPGQPRGAVLLIRIGMADCSLHSPRCLRRRWRTDSDRRHTVRRVQGPRQGCMVRDIGACHDGRPPCRLLLSCWDLHLTPVGLVSRDWTLALWGCGTILASLLTVILATHPVSAVVDVRNYVAAPLRVVADPDLHGSYTAASAQVHL